jgi:hypothetical protein
LGASFLSTTMRRRAQRSKLWEMIAESTMNVRIESSG